MSGIYDAVVIGGGPAGASAGWLLARAGWNVVICERQTMPRPKVCGEYVSATNLPLFDAMGLGDVFRDIAGPPVRHVGLYCRRMCLEASLPTSTRNAEFGRALSRQRLDPLLLDQARLAGAEIRQPFSVIHYERTDDVFRFQIKNISTGASHEINARLAIAAHGSWNAGTLPSQPPRQPHAPGELLGFKAHFSASNLPEGLMPLLAFGGGYGGMVHEEAGRVSISCCVRRDLLASLRADQIGDAGEVIESYLRDSCRGVRDALEGARREGPWLSAGPIRPGIRLRHPLGVFAIGNAAGEAHPVVAEGISMAMQSAWLLQKHLSRWRSDGGEVSALANVARHYARDWRRHFRPRLTASAAIAAWAMRPWLIAASAPALRIAPSLLTWGARLSGKTTSLEAAIGVCRTEG